MKLGAFSLSLSVKDIARSKAFYETLGFAKFHGDEDQKWLILKNGSGRNPRQPRRRRSGASQHHADRPRW